ncbi:MarR family transcriptional regulator [soil metagenome]
MAEHLTAAGNRAWRALALTSHLLAAELERQTQRDAGMPHIYFVILAALYEAPEHRLRAGALAEFAQISPSRLSHAVRSMQSSGWVGRERAEADGRGQEIRLTPDGVDAVRRFAPLQQSAVRVPLLGGLSDAEATTLAELLEPMVAHLGESPTSWGWSSPPEEVSRASR